MGGRSGGGGASRTEADESRSVRTTCDTSEKKGAPPADSIAARAGEPVLLTEGKAGAGWGSFLRIFP